MSELKLQTDDFIFVGSRVFAFLTCGRKTICLLYDALDDRVPVYSAECIRHPNDRPDTWIAKRLSAKRTCEKMTGGKELYHKFREQQAESVACKLFHGRIAKQQHAEIERLVERMFKEHGGVLGKGVLP